MYYYCCMKQLAIFMFIKIHTVLRPFSGFKAHVVPRQLFVLNSVLVTYFRE